MARKLGQAFAMARAASFHCNGSKAELRWQPDTHPQTRTPQPHSLHPPAATAARHSPPNPNPSAYTHLGADGRRIALDEGFKLEPALGPLPMAPGLLDILVLVAPRIPSSIRYYPLSHLVRFF